VCLFDVVCSFAAWRPPPGGVSHGCSVCPLPRCILPIFSAPSGLPLDFGAPPCSSLRGTSLTYRHDSTPRMSHFRRSFFLFLTSRSSVSLFNIRFIFQFRTLPRVLPVDDPLRNWVTLPLLFVGGCPFSGEEKPPNQSRTAFSSVG
jgi:hypothetical protein